MRKTQLNEKDYNTFFKTIIYGDVSDFVGTSIHSAYRDLCRTIRGFQSNPNHNKIYSNSVDILKKGISELLSVKINSQEDYDKWHKKTSESLIRNFADQNFTYGQAQKWINMTMKNLSMINHNYIEKVYEYCHVPIDNYVLSVTKYNDLKVAWSKLNSYEEYLKFQEWFRSKYKGLALDEEFYLWINESIKRKEN